MPDNSVQAGLCDLNMSEHASDTELLVL